MKPEQYDEVAAAMALERQLRDLEPTKFRQYVLDPTREGQLVALLAEWIYGKPLEDAKPTSLVARTWEAIKDDIIV